MGMIDRFTAMSWLEGLAQDDWRECHSDSEVQEIARQTLALLKEQEPVEPIRHYTTNSSIPTVMKILYTCGACMADILKCDKYCSHCGREVKWDG